MIKLSDWLAQKVVELGVRHVFMVTGGGAMHLNHSLGSHKDLSCVFNHHEQACAIGAEAYYRLSNRLPLVNVTSGPGGTNAITGVYGAFVDSVGMVVISGQVKFETTVRSTGLPLRQYGDQELDIIELVRPITKYCEMVTDPQTIRYHIEKAFYLATSGRPGPCWLDIPLDVQAAKIDPDTLVGFDPSEIEEPWKKTDLTAASQAIFDRIAKAERPVIFAGGGVRLSGRHDAFLKLIDKLGIPVVTGWNAHDALFDDHFTYAGRPGTIGDRGGNFVVQNSDCLLVLGSRLNIRQVSYNWKSFAREAYKIWVEIDETELKKPSVKPDMPVLASLTDILPVMAETEYSGPTEQHKKWLAWAKAKHEQFPAVLPEYWHNQLVNPYCFMDALFGALDEDQIVVTGNGSACVISFQAAALKRGQRLWTNSGCATMGYDLPAAIGACTASGGKPIVCLAGDGSIMMNLQEMQTIIGNGLPIKIFLLNNSGYVSIFQTHRNFFNGVEIGGGPKSGVTFPDFEPVSKAFGFSYVRCARHQDMADAISATMQADGPSVCEIMLDENVAFAPKLGAKQLPDGRIISPPLEDLSPFLPRDQFRASMIIDTIDE
ncbi:thiamine pyrophosphate-binding protein [Rhodopseudomonas palustris]|uniref:Possible acetolactate synthase large subunit n=1 Tax=Rhodopseudomonas palustris (strain ATCC BAA-98 / CGA009) TaxID=258594 RepID=Q6N2J6_RHOPA|nr:thiamine pyrophosphate-binding protein [Rhodopseudomonas palustris]OPF92537.1 acetolactate synthase [Rhodopseudomonas palustris]PPQ43486.1 acetolactate synthase [Rhodopseudomonas palustris]QQM05616.1 Acetolactate synthase isozyme 2 large subunit [Rhodopseudomonas palustris]RJF63847.1 thiamine pyrophosphate-binding protein [Rhodopseudomonas palustris]WAB76947.1 thiamine pyrophosphate-binding protein [Rhodopseudomonas palustris]